MNSIEPSITHCSYLRPNSSPGDHYYGFSGAEQLSELRLNDVIKSGKRAIVTFQKPFDHRERDKVYKRKRWEGLSHLWANTNDIIRLKVGVLPRFFVSQAATFIVSLPKRIDDSRNTRNSTTSIFCRPSSKSSNIPCLR